MRRAASRWLLMAVPAFSSAACVFEHSSTLALDGSTCALHAEGAGAALPMGADPYTLEADIQTTHGGQRGIMSWGTFTADEVNAFRLDGDQGEALMNYWYSNDLQSPLAPSAHLADGEWHRVAATWDGTKQALFVDGKQLVERTPSAKPNIKTKDSFCVGASSPTFDKKFQGSMRNIKILNVARTLEQLGEACGGWGAPVLWLLAVGGACYVGGGVAYGQRTGRSSSRQGRYGILSVHPHWHSWLELAGLCHDGARYVRSRVQGTPPEREQTSLERSKRSSETRSPASEERKSKGKRRDGSKEKRKQARDSAGGVDAAPLLTAGAASAAGPPDGGGGQTAVASTTSGGGGRWVHVDGG